MTTTHVDLDLVLTVAGELRRLCQRAASTCNMCYNTSCTPHEAHVRLMSCH